MKQNKMKINQEEFNRKAQHILDTVVKPQVERYEKAKEQQKITMSYFRRLYKDFVDEKITMSRMVELLNEQEDVPQTTTIRIQLTESQQTKLDAWLYHIKELFGETGQLTWMITPTGIGSEITVYSELVDLQLDLTETETW